MIDLDMLLGGSVARFTRNTQLTDARIQNARGGIRPRLAAGAVAIDAIDVPQMFRRRDRRVAKKGLMKRNPTLVLDQPRERKNHLQVAEAAGNPINLHVM